MTRSINRRDFVKSATVLGGVFMVGGCKTNSASQIDSKLKSDDLGAQRVRYSVYSNPGQYMLEVYNQIVGYLKTTKHGDQTYWQLQANIHHEHCPHGNWFFLPWHRAYIYHFEEICREVASTKVERLAGVPQDCYDNWTIPLLGLEFRA